MLDYVGYFFVYSFAGFLLETLFALVFQGGFAMRKCFLLFPMCPVYGFGALAILLLAGSFKQNLFAVFGIGMLAASAVEYITDLVYREAIGVAFWDYNDLPAFFLSLGTAVGGPCTLFASRCRAYDQGNSQRASHYLTDPLFNRCSSKHSASDPV